MKKANSNANEFKPFISADKIIPEMTFTSILLGIILAVVFGAANAYLGLKVGMTVSASIPAAVISMGLIRVILKRDSILENNLVQTIGSAGESLAAGAIFTLPAIFMWIKEGKDAHISFLAIAVVTIAGGLLGILFMIPLRTALIVKEHETIPYPEGTACAEVLIAGETGGSAASIVFSGLGIASIYKFFSEGLTIFPQSVSFSIKKYKGSAIGGDLLPALLGVGYICGLKIASYMFAGGVLAWFVLMPLLSLFGGNAIIAPGSTPISQCDPFLLWKNYIKYIGAGAVAAGGIISLAKSTPLIIRTFVDNIASLKNTSSSDNSLRTNRDLSIKFIGIAVVVICAVLLLTPGLPFNIPTLILILVFGFFFATVSSRMVGLVGSSNNPVSGMAIATLLVSSFALKEAGNAGISGMVAAIMIGTVVCIIAAIAGDTSQDLKTGYIVGATPRTQQIGEFIGVIASGLAITGVLYLLDKAWGFGSKELAAPQAGLMKVVVEGVMSNNLPWTLVFIGISIAVVFEILGLPVLPIAIGLYLPITTSTPIVLGGLVRYFVEKRAAKKNEEAKEEVVTNGILYSSGLIAGEGLVGIILAIFQIIPVKGYSNFAEYIALQSRFANSSNSTLRFISNIFASDILGIITFLLLTLSLVAFCHKKKHN
ncbi:OPT family oligopeptide transporter [Lachnobacterium bovis]|uniref:Putative oligopeptide transporter, OPT family n=1 Tax=Lachnobacterium bovis TaxID=140626 RepID=A0A1H9SB38_9FIRM|nr:oligopeptide transporter, OPT family [Lachnobacterium bovis]SER82207.1 putative oligopeptide transporter, OPT family [Lachnobacterium bovis]